MNELFPVIVRKDNPYYPYSISAERPDLLPGYVITAEIKDLFINVCDQYDWRTRTYSHLRSGSAEIQVLWRVMTPFNRKLYWEDVTRGYAEIQTPVRDGEIRLIEKPLPMLWYGLSACRDLCRQCAMFRIPVIWKRPKRNLKRWLTSTKNIKNYSLPIGVNA